MANPVGTALEEDRPEPRDIEAETAVLGAVLLNNKLWPEVSGRLTDQDFYRSAHQLLWQSMSRLAARGSALDLVTLRSDLSSHGHLDAVGGAVYIAQLLDGVPKSSNVPHYAGIVRDMSRLRAVLAIANKVKQEVFSGETATSVAEVAVSELMKQMEPPDDGAADIGPSVAEYVESLDDPNADAAAPTGFLDLDQTMGGGLRYKDVVILAARPSVGKSSLALSIARNTAGAGLGTAYFSLEMSRRSLTSRLLSEESKIPQQRLSDRRLTQDEYGRIAAAIESTRPLPLKVIDNAMTLGEITAWCHQLKQQPSGLKVVIIDYIQLIRSTTRMQNRENEVSAMSRAIKSLAKELDVVVIALSQLSRAPEGRKDKRPQLSDLRESGALEQDADVAMLLFREEMHDPSDENAGIAEVIIAKQRNGPTGVKRLYFAKDYSWFRNLLV